MTNAIEVALGRRRRVSSLTAWLTRAVMRILGWRLVGDKPNLAKYVLVAAPHTSAWDFLVMLALDFAFKVESVWMGKQSLFRGPLGVYMRHMGGIPVDRASAHNMVEQAVSAFERHEKMVMVISPEGTRSVAQRWKTGFYYIALGAQVPIVCGFIDFAHKRAGFGPVVVPSGDIEADMLVLHEFYHGIEGKHPQNVGRVVVSPAEP